MEFKTSVFEQLSSLINKQTHLVVPETTNVNLLNMVNDLSSNVIFLEKNSIAVVKEAINSQAMMRAERNKLNDLLDSMETIKMASIPGNQRKRFLNLLFKPVTLGNVVYFDDSIFSGYTFKAALNAINGNVLNNVVLFSK